MVYSLESRVRHTLSRIGSTAKILDSPVGAEFFASVQPVRDRGLQNLRTGVWGKDRRRRAAVYAPFSAGAKGLSAGVRINWRGETYRILQVETVSMGGRGIYIWAMAEPEGGEN